MKKIICALLVATLAFSLVACSNGNDDAPTTENTTASTTQPTGRIYYDKYGNEFETLEDLPFYDDENNKHYLVNQVEQIFIDQGGKEFDGAKCFVDTHGTFVYDENGEIELVDSLSAKDKNGKMFYPAATVRWTVDKVMVNAFGFGQEVVPD